MCDCSLNGIQGNENPSLVSHFVALDTENGLRERKSNGGNTEIIWQNGEYNIQNMA